MGGNDDLLKVPMGDATKSMGAPSRPAPFMPPQVAPQPQPQQPPQPKK
jgi:hypothetical protein